MQSQNENRVTINSLQQNLICTAIKMLASMFEKASLNKDLIPKNHAICCLNPYPTPSLDKLLLKISFEEKTSISVISMHVCMPLKNC